MVQASASERTPLGCKSQFQCLLQTLVRKLELKKHMKSKIFMILKILVSIFITHQHLTYLYLIYNNFIIKIIRRKVVTREELNRYNRATPKITELK